VYRGIGTTQRYKFRRSSSLILFNYINLDWIEIYARKLKPAKIDFDM
jgi:hypothetical protein